LTSAGGSKSIIHELTGGLIDLYLIVDGTYEETVQEYHKLVGKPLLPPLWGLGWHQSKYGYENTAALNAVVNGYATDKIPLEAIWSDIDYMDGFQDFTVDPSAFEGLADSIATW